MHTPTQNTRLKKIFLEHRILYEETPSSIFEKQLSENETVDEKIDALQDQEKVNYDQQINTIEAGAIKTMAMIHATAYPNRYEDGAKDALTSITGTSAEDIIQKLNNDDKFPKAEVSRYRMIVKTLEQGRPVAPEEGKKVDAYFQSYLGVFNSFKGFSENQSGEGARGMMADKNGEVLKKYEKIKKDHPHFEMEKNTKTNNLNFRYKKKDGKWSPMIECKSGLVKIGTTGENNKTIYLLDADGDMSFYGPKGAAFVSTAGLEKEGNNKSVVWDMSTGGQPDWTITAEEWQKLESEKRDAQKEAQQKKEQKERIKAKGKSPDQESESQKNSLESKETITGTDKISPYIDLRNPDKADLEERISSLGYPKVLWIANYEGTPPGETIIKHTAKELQEGSKILDEIYREADKTLPYIFIDNEGKRVSRLAAGETYPENQKIKDLVTEFNKIVDPNINFSKPQNLYKIGEAIKKYPDKEDTLIPLFAQIRCEQEKALGLNTLQLVLDEGSNDSDHIIGVRGYSKEPAKRLKLAKAFIDAAHERKMAVVLKHFPGHGREGIKDTHIHRQPVDEVNKSDPEAKVFFNALNHAQSKSAPIFVMLSQIVVKDGELKTEDSEGNLVPTTQSPRIVQMLIDAGATHVITDDMTLMNGANIDDGDTLEKARERSREAGAIVLGDETVQWPEPNK